MKATKRIALAAVVSFPLAGCVGAPVHEVQGTLTLGDGVTQHSPTGGECTGYGGYDDITPGAQVVVSSEGETVGKGSLDEGVYEDGWCSFPFTVTDVPGGNAFYTVEVSHRGGLEFSEDELSEPIDLSLGF